VTTRLLDELPEREVLAVVGHELSHLAHRDALVMSILAGPSVAALRGIPELWRRGGRFAVAATFFGAFIAPPALALAAISRVVSRHRELAADRGAALLTGSPAAVASALARLADELERLPRADLRAVAPRDPFHLLPTDPREKGACVCSGQPIRALRCASPSSSAWSPRCSRRVLQ